MRFRIAVAGFAAVTATIGLLGPTGTASAVSDALSDGTVVVYGNQFGPPGTGTTGQHMVRAHMSPNRQVKAGRPVPVAPAAKVSRGLAAAVEASPSTRQRLVVTLAEDRKVPRLPDPDPALPTSAAVNQRALAKADGLIATLRSQRASGYRTLGAELASLDVRILDTFWLINGVLVDAPLAAVPSLSKRPDVRYLELQETDAVPPADGNPNNDEEDARALMRTDPYFGYNQGWIGLLDSGVRRTHTVFNGPSHLRNVVTVVNEANPNPDDDCWNHGTSSAAVLTGNGNLGAAYRGMTGITLDSYKVYPSGRDEKGECRGADYAASIRGFQRAVAALDRVIVAELQFEEGENGGLAAAADAAFDAGAVVIAANGNSGPDARTVRSPAVAHKAIGVGAVDIGTQSVRNDTSRGPTADNRTKPDLLAVTNVETASNVTDNATRVFPRTSGATPHAAAAAALLRNWMRGGDADIEPGNVYATLIASGALIGANPGDNANGAGMLRLPNNAAYYKVEVPAYTTVDVRDWLYPTGYNLQFAAWWPENTATHNDIDLEIFDPNNETRGLSNGVMGVFERVALALPEAGGEWRMSVTNYSPRSQTVYLAAAFLAP